MRIRTQVKNALRKAFTTALVVSISMSAYSGRVLAQETEDPAEVSASDDARAQQAVLAADEIRLAAGSSNGEAEHVKALFTIAVREMAGLEQSNEGSYVALAFSNVSDAMESAHVFADIAHELGVGCTVVSADSTTVVWNLVNINGVWYHVDVWSAAEEARSDLVYDDSDGALADRWLLVGDDEIAGNDDVHSNWVAEDGSVSEASPTGYEWDVAEESDELADESADALEDAGAVGDGATNSGDVLEGSEHDGVGDAEDEPSSPDASDGDELELELTAQAQTDSQKKNIANAKASIAGKQAGAELKWTGKAVTPKPTVTYGSVTLRENRDYMLSYKNNVQPGTATITITGKGDYAGTKTVTFKIGPKTGAWKKSGSLWWYRYSDGTYPKSGIVSIDGAKYCFDASGWMQTGWKKVSGSWYYFSSSGKMSVGWVKSGSSWYWLDKSTGKMKTGWLTEGGSKYFLKSDGSMATGWQKVGQLWYWFNSSGRMARSRWVGNYYVGSNGAMLTNALTPDGYRVLANGCWDGKGKVPLSKTVRVGGASPYRVKLPGLLLADDRYYDSARCRVASSSGITFLEFGDYSYAKYLENAVKSPKKVDIGEIGTVSVSGVGTLTIYGMNDGYYAFSLFSPNGDGMAFVIEGSVARKYFSNSKNASSYNLWCSAMSGVVGRSGYGETLQADTQFAIEIAKLVVFE